LLAQGLQLAAGLPATLMFDYPSIADIAAFLLAQLQRDSATDFEPSQSRADAAPLQTAGDGPQRMTAALLDELSDAEVERLLNEKLEQL
jgi:hypothetical protein